MRIPTCMAFSMDVAQGTEKIAACPYISKGAENGTKERAVQEIKNLLGFLAKDIRGELGEREKHSLEKTQKDGVGT